MSDEKTPVMLILMVRTRSFAWFVAAIDPRGQAKPLVRSEEGNLQQYVGLEPDEQLNFLRHRLSGALQRGFDRLWGKDYRASHVVLLTDDDFAEGSPELTQRVADHFFHWMTRPPVISFRAPRGWDADDVPPLDRLAGELDEPQTRALQAGLPQLVQTLDRSELWEVCPNRRSNA